MIRVLFYTGIALLFLSSCTSKSIDVKEKANNDSIQKYLDLADNQSLDIRHRNIYNNKAVLLIDLKKNDSLTRLYLYKLNITLSKLGKIESLKKFSKILVEKSNIAKDSITLSEAFHCLGYAFMMDSQNELAIKYFFKAKKGFSSKSLIREELAVMRNIALTQSFANDFLGSIQTSLEIIKKSKRHKIYYEINSAYLNIGNNFSYLKNERKAIEYYQKVLDGKENINSELALNNNIANSYIQLGEYEKAFVIIRKSIKDTRFRHQKSEEIGSVNSLLGLYYLKIKQSKKAYFFLKKAENIFKSTTVLNGENYNYIYMSEYFAQVKDTSNSISAANRALILSKRYKNPTDILLSLQQIIKVDKKLAFEHAQEYIRINDSLQIAERKFRDKFAEIRYETEEISKEKEVAVKQKWITGIVSGIMISIAIIFLINIRERNKQKELKLLREQQKANEEIYQLMLTQKTKEYEARQNEKKRIALELHDGVMNKLASTRLNLDVLNHKKDSETIEKSLIYIAQIYQIEQEIRNISHDLVIEKFGENNSFVALINDLIVTQNNISSSRYILEMEKSIDWENILSSIKMNLFRIIQEASHNINKFSNAKIAIISIILDGNNLCLSITDDGTGFDTEIKSEGIGLKNIRQRVESLNGKFIIQSVKNKSTSLNIAIPIK